MPHDDATQAAVRRWHGGPQVEDDAQLTPVQIMVRDGGGPDSRWRPKLRVGAPPRTGEDPLTADEAQRIAAAWNAEMTALYGPGHDRAAVIA